MCFMSGKRLNQQLLLIHILSITNTWLYKTHTLLNYHLDFDMVHVREREREFFFKPNDIMI